MMKRGISGLSANGGGVSALRSRQAWRLMIRELTICNKLEGLCLVCFDHLVMFFY